MEYSNDWILFLDVVKSLCVPEFDVRAGLEFKRKLSM